MHLAATEQTQKQTNGRRSRREKAQDGFSSDLGLLEALAVEATSRECSLLSRLMDVLEMS